MDSATNQSGSWPLFRQAAADLAERLLAANTPATVSLAREARDLEEILRGWEVVRPDSETRVATIERLFDVNRIAMDLLSQSSKAVSGVRTIVREPEASYGGLRLRR